MSDVRTVCYTCATPLFALRRSNHDVRDQISWSRRRHSWVLCGFIRSRQETVLSKRLAPLLPYSGQTYPRTPSNTHRDLAPLVPGEKNLHGVATLRDYLEKTFFILFIPCIVNGLQTPTLQTNVQFHYYAFRTHLLAQMSAQWWWQLSRNM